MQIENKEYIAENLLFNNHEYKYAADASFQEGCIGNSQGLLELVMLVKDQFKVTVDDEDITPDNFDSVNLLAKYIRQKSGS